MHRFLADAGLANLLGILEARFERVYYFGASALGRLPDPMDESPFEPRGVLAPLVWLGHETGALSDAPGITRAGGNFRLFFRRALRGQEGTATEVAAWGVALGGLAVLIDLLWHLGVAALGIGALTAGALFVLQARGYRAQGIDPGPWLRRWLSQVGKAVPAAGPVADANLQGLHIPVLAAVLGVGLLWFVCWPLGCLVGGVAIPMIVCACFAGAPLPPADGAGAAGPMRLDPVSPATYTSLD